VFDSTVTFADKAAHMEDADALQATVESYTTAGSAMGGISLVPTDVVIDGDTATVTYDVMFGESAAYTALTGEISNVAGTWTVSRAEFCSFMVSARNACPA
jgi:iron complex transport system substrate-binding protein